MQLTVHNQIIIAILSESEVMILELALIASARDSDELRCHTLATKERKMATEFYNAKREAQK